MSTKINRRDFLASAAALSAIQIVPRHVIGGPGYIPPSDKITLAHIGCGTEGFHELPPLLTSPELQIVAVCDPNRESTDYRNWMQGMLQGIVRAVIQEPGWREGEPGIPGGRDVMKEVVETFYAKHRGTENFSGVAAYADYREMLEKEDFDAVKIMTPDHHHAGISIACMNKGKHVVVHKPLANRMNESKLVIETARKTGVATYFMPWGSNADMTQVMEWIDGGLIGNLKEVHNWSSRPVWPQYPTIPTDEPPIPDGFDWDLWLGPCEWRPYHPNYTHMVFRGWYDFGGGSIADMGHYSLWAVLKALELDPPLSARATQSHACSIINQVSRPIHNDYSFPLASTVSFEFEGKAGRGPVKLTWYDGGMKPPFPDELEENNEEFAAEGMMFVGDEGKILGDFWGNTPRIIPNSRHEQLVGDVPEPPPPMWDIGADQDDEEDPLGLGLPPMFTRLEPGLQQWIKTCKGEADQPTGNFLEANTISEMANLAFVALRAGKKVEYDTNAMKITNDPAANEYLTRKYRKGWEL